MDYILEILSNLIGWDFDFKVSKSYNCLFSFWDIENEADISEIEDLFKKGIITRQDADILLLHRKEILIELQTILNESENHTKKESIRLVWKAMKKYGLSDDYIKFTIAQLYHLF